MRVPGPIRTEHLFAPLHGELMTLVGSLTADEWNAPTVAGAWTVKDVAAHLLDSALRRLSMQRDGYVVPLPPGDLGAAIAPGGQADLLLMMPPLGVLTRDIEPVL